jgi:hypothetical protein
LRGLEWVLRIISFFWLLRWNNKIILSSCSEKTCDIKKYFPFRNELPNSLVSIKPPRKIILPYLKKKMIKKKTERYFPFPKPQNKKKIYFDFNITKNEK